MDGSVFDALVSLSPEQAFFAGSFVAVWIATFLFLLDALTGVFELLRLYFIKRHCQQLYKDGSRIDGVCHYKGCPHRETCCFYKKYPSLKVRFQSLFRRKSAPVKGCANCKGGSLCASLFAGKMPGACAYWTEKKS